jgi:hypothetical protein
VPCFNKARFVPRLNIHDGIGVGGDCLDLQFVEVVVEIYTRVCGNKVSDDRITMRKGGTRASSQCCHEIQMTSALANIFVTCTSSVARNEYSPLGCD